MSVPLEPLPPAPTGTGPIFQWARRIHKCIAARTILGISGGSIDRKLNGQWIRVDEQVSPSGSGVDVGFFQIYSHTDTESTCHRIITDSDGNETISPDVTIVQKPLEYREGATRVVSKTVSGSTTNITQELVPSYAIDERIAAILFDDGQWWEVAPYRSYLDAYQRLVVCSRVNGQDVRQYILVRGSVPFGSVA